MWNNNQRPEDLARQFFKDFNSLTMQMALAEKSIKIAEDGIAQILKDLTQVRDEIDALRREQITPEQFAKHLSDLEKKIAHLQSNQNEYKTDLQTLAPKVADLEKWISTEIDRRQSNKDDARAITVNLLTAGAIALFTFLSGLIGMGWWYQYHLNTPPALTEDTQ